MAAALLPALLSALLAGATAAALPPTPPHHPRPGAPRPHILFVMADDLGHGNVEWYRKDGPVPEVQTPALSALVAEGVRLDRVYSYSCCSPTRSSFISGRLPLHVNVLNTDPATFNESTGEGAGVATEMTGIGQVMARAGYTTAVVVRPAGPAPARRFVGVHAHRLPLTRGGSGTGKVGRCAPPSPALPPRAALLC